MSDKRLKQLDVKLHNFMVSQLEFNNNISGPLITTIQNQNYLISDFIERKCVSPVCMSAIL